MDANLEYFCVYFLDMLKNYKLESQEGKKNQRSTMRWNPVSFGARLEPQLIHEEEKEEEEEEEEEEEAFTLKVRKNIEIMELNGERTMVLVRDDPIKIVKIGTDLHEDINAQMAHAPRRMHT